MKLAPTQFTQLFGVLLSGLHSIFGAQPSGSLCSVLSGGRRARKRRVGPPLRCACSRWFECADALLDLRGDRFLECLDGLEPDPQTAARGERQDALVIAAGREPVRCAHSARQNRRQPSLAFRNFPVPTLESCGKIDCATGIILFGSCSEETSLRKRKTVERLLADEEASLAAIDAARKEQKLKRSGR